MIYETVPCQYCGRQTEATTIRVCAACWEVTHRLEDFLRTSEGMAFVESMIAKVRYIPKTPVPAQGGHSREPGREPDTDV